MDKKGESRIRRWRVGRVNIVSIMESADRIPWAPLFPAENSELYKKYDWLVPRFITAEGDPVGRVVRSAPNWRFVAE